MEKEIKQVLSDVAPENSESEKDALLADTKRDIALLMGKHAESLYEENIKIKNLEAALFASKKKLQEKYPDRLEEIEIFFDLWETNHDQGRIGELKNKERECEQECSQLRQSIHRTHSDKEREESIQNLKRRTSSLEKIKNEKRNIFMNLTSWNFLVANHVINNKGKRGYLSEFWNVLGEIDTATGGTSFEGKKRGIMGQAGLYHIMREAGSNPDLATPKEDAFKKTDLKLHVPGSKNVLIQAKHTVLERDVIFESTDDMAYPGVQTRDGDARKHFSEKHIKEMGHLARSCKRESEETGEMVSGYYVVLPEGSLDNITAEPRPDVVELFKKKLATLS